MFFFHFTRNHVQPVPEILLLLLLLLLLVPWLETVGVK